MDITFDSTVIKNFKEYYDQGYRSILYEVDEDDNMFTVHLKNFNNERTKLIKCEADDGQILKNYIDRLT